MIPPGEILLEEYLKPLGIGQVEAARTLISLNRLNEIVCFMRASPPLRHSGYRVSAEDIAQMWIITSQLKMQQAVLQRSAKGIVGKLFFTVPVLYLILRFRAILGI